MGGAKVLPSVLQVTINGGTKRRLPESRSPSLHAASQSQSHSTARMRTSFSTSVRLWVANLLITSADARMACLIRAKWVTTRWRVAGTALSGDTSGVSRRLRGPRQTLTYLHRIVPQQRGLRAMLPTLSSQICPNPEFGSRQMPMLLRMRLSSAEPPRNDRDRASAAATSARDAMARVRRTLRRLRTRRIAGLQN